MRNSYRWSHSIRCWRSSSPNVQSNTQTNEKIYIYIYICIWRSHMSAASAVCHDINRIMIFLYNQFTYHIFSATRVLLNMYTQILSERSQTTFSGNSLRIIFRPGYTNKRKMQILIIFREYFFRTYMYFWKCVWLLLECFVL